MRAGMARPRGARLALRAALFAASAPAFAEGETMFQALVGRIQQALHPGAPAPAPAEVSTPAPGPYIPEEVPPWEPADANGCTKRFQAPQDAPLHATDLNGFALPDVCYLDKQGPHHVFAIGDWGGIRHGPTAVVPADHRSFMFKSHHRPFVIGVDNRAQQNVAEAMAQRAATARPDYFLNVGDNFYWGGIDVKCGAPAYNVQDPKGQWEVIFEKMYSGLGVDGKQWLGVLGNHDYGGWMFTMGWDQAIGYTWSTHLPTSTSRWMTPAQYYSAKVRYPDFSVEYFFVDTNIFDTWEKADFMPAHNICGRKHNLEGAEATCGDEGPVSVEDCPGWFHKLWETQKQWLEGRLAASQADWQIVVTHFPPEKDWGMELWKRLSYDYGIDLIITGHRHWQNFMYHDGFLGPTGVIVTGGGGGITSENTPDPNGVDDQYGFADLTLTRHEIMVEMVSHQGQMRFLDCVTPRGRSQAAPAAFMGPGKSLCAGKPKRGPEAHTPTEEEGVFAPDKTWTTTSTPSAAAVAYEGAAAPAAPAAPATPAAAAAATGTAYAGAAAAYQQAPAVPAAAAAPAATAAAAAAPAMAFQRRLEVANGTVFGSPDEVQAKAPLQI